jgi:hypothetical protein
MLPTHEAMRGQIRGTPCRQLCANALRLLDKKMSKNKQRHAVTSFQAVQIRGRYNHGKKIIH